MTRYNSTTDGPRFLVYGLVDPRTDRVMYVGSSSRGLRRPKEHNHPYNLSRDGDSPKARWIKALQEEGLEYLIRILEICSTHAEALEKERILTRGHREANSLLANKADVYIPSGWKLSDTTRVKMSEARRAWHARQPPERRAQIIARIAQQNRGRKHTPEHCAKISLASAKRRRRSEQECRAIAERVARWHAEMSPEERARISARMSALRVGYKPSPESIAKTKAGNTGKIRTTEQRKATSEAIRKWHAAMTPEEKEARSRKLRGLKRSEETRAKMRKPRGTPIKPRKPVSAETRRRMSEAQKRRFAKVMAATDATEPEQW